MSARAYQIYMPDTAWDYIDSLQKESPRKGRGAFIAEILMQDKKRRERAEKQKQPELDKTA